jgi:hypothetical protein
MTSLNISVIVQLVSIIISKWGKVIRQRDVSVGKLCALIVVPVVLSEKSMLVTLCNHNTLMSFDVPAIVDVLFEQYQWVRLKDVEYLSSFVCNIEKNVTNVETFEHSLRDIISMNQVDIDRNTKDIFDIFESLGRCKEEIEKIDLCMRLLEYSGLQFRTNGMSVMSCNLLLAKVESQDVRVERRVLSIIEQGILVPDAYTEVVVGHMALARLLSGTILVNDKEVGIESAQLGHTVVSDVQSTTSWCNVLIDYLDTVAPFVALRSSVDSGVSNRGLMVSGRTRKPPLGVREMAYVMISPRRLGSSEHV